MQSSAAVAGRALIMLACVVGIPALALSGASWSEMLKKLQDFRWPAILDPASASTSASVSEAPRFAPSNPTVAPAAGRGPAQLAPAGAPSLVGEVPVPIFSQPLPGQPAAPAQSAIIPAGYQESAAILPPVVGAADASAAGAAPSAADPFCSIQDRLRQLGATYYLLESWGSGQQMYRFYCKMAVGGSADYTRYFEATNSEPLQAMFQVLRQVETWKQSRGRERGTRN